MSEEFRIETEYEMLRTVPVLVLRWDLPDGRVYRTHTELPKAMVDHTAMLALFAASSRDTTEQHVHPVTAGAAFRAVLILPEAWR